MSVMKHELNRYLLTVSICLWLAGCVPTTRVVIERLAPPEADVSGIREIAVLSFSAADSAPQYARDTESRLVSVLVQTGRYRVLKRTETERILKEAGINFSYPPGASMVRKVGAALGVDAVIYGVVEGYQFDEESRLVKVKEKVWTGDYERDRNGAIVSDIGDDGQAVPRKIYEKRLVEKNRLKRYAGLQIHYRMADSFHGNVICAESESETGSWERTGAAEIAQLPGREAIFDLFLDRATKDFVRNIAPHPIDEEKFLESGVFHSTRLGVELAKNNLWDEAVDKWLQAVKSAPDDPAAYYNLGVAFERKGLFDLANRSYQNALIRRPKSKRYIKAITHIQKLMKELQ